MIKLIILTQAMYTYVYSLSKSSIWFSNKQTWAELGQGQPKFDSDTDQFSFASLFLKDNFALVLRQIELIHDLI